MNTKRQIFGLSLLLLCIWCNTLVVNYRDNRVHSDFSRFFRDFARIHAIFSYDERFRELKNALPKRGTIGYLTSVKEGDLKYDVRAIGRYYQTQYSLVPIVVDSSPSYSLVVGDFDTNTAKIEDWIPKEMTVNDYGNGAFLLKRIE